MNSYENINVAFNDPKELMGSLCEDMSELYRTVFTLQFYEDFSAEEIAAAVERPVWFVQEICDHFENVYLHCLTALDKEISNEN